MKISALLLSLFFVATLGNATESGDELLIHFTDPIGDNSGNIDVASMNVTFNNVSGQYQATVTAYSEAPFIGEFRININLYNPSAENPLFQDAINDYRTTRPTSSIILAGQSDALIGWNAGDRVAASTTDEFGNPPVFTLFRSSALDFDHGNALNCVNPFPNICDEDAIAAQQVFLIVPAAEKRLTISPPSGEYVATQQFDLVLLMDVPDHSITGLSATFDDADVSGLLTSCFAYGIITPTGISARCPDILGDNLGLGTHRMNVVIDLNDGSTIQDVVTWRVIENRE